NPMKCPELDLQPVPIGGVELSENMQQTLAALTGFWRNKRVLLKASPSGALFVTSPQIKDIFHVVGVGANDTYKGENIPCSEVMIMGHPDNTGKIWVKPHVVATIDNAWPVAANDVVGLSITNLNMLNLLIVVDGEKAIVAYTI
ncbi:unnamed protein product, partial [marine sediment metagenome]